MTALVGRGMTPADGIRAVTANVTELLGVAHGGRIAEGILADLHPVAGDQLQHAMAGLPARWVMEGGIVVRRRETGGSSQRGD